jgi:hypothetical protein
MGSFFYKKLKHVIPMSDITRYKKKIIYRSFILFALGFLFLAVTQGNKVSFGFFLGFCISVINFHLLSIDIMKVNTFGKNDYQSVLILRYFMRYLMIGLAMFCAFKYNLNPIAFLAGVFLVQSILFFDNVKFVRQSS